jgi:succinoglycan biosynthesis protein ExoV
MLGIDRSFAAIDPAILTSRIYDSATSVSPGSVFMPHHSTHASAGTELRAICETIGLHYVSPLDDAEAIIAKIAAARRVVTEALHGAVVAESYDVPWVPVVFGSKVLAEKWLDFAASIGVEYQPVEIHTNIAFDGKVRFFDRVKYTVAKAGLGKDKHKYLPIRRATVSALSALEGKLRDLMTSNFGLVRSAQVKAASIARLDAAIGTFTEAFQSAAAKRTAS